MDNKFKISELIEYLDNIYLAVVEEWGLWDEPDRPKIEEIKKRLLKSEEGKNEK